ncbi:hypothetical protein DLJ82_6699 (plasmid) [Rhizobium leguminosarum]|uniref:CHAD domain-containing protein n=1 Tax=Rhizobium leguminosarum TaxID=384 RepID=A0A2Z4YU91_RHILE|nr:hypothetical protein DLJ82_6699 [Rhizobium leguminosarum]
MGDEPKRIQEELRWLAGVLGEARNLDVLLMKAKDSDLRAKLKDARNEAYGDAVEALESARARALIIDFNEWLQCDLDRTGGSATSEDTPSVTFEGDVAVGTALPDTVEIHTIPDQTDYGYVVVNKKRVLVNPKTRTVIEVIK